MTTVKTMTPTIRPGKHSHPDQTVVGVALLLLGRLKRVRAEAYDDLLARVRKQVRGADQLFLPALDLLFLLGLLEYRPKTDSIEYVRSHEAV